AALARQPRHGAVALEMIEMAAGAADRGVGLDGATGHVLGRPRLAEIGPRLLGEIIADRQHVVALEGGRDRLHDVALAVAALEVAQLDIDVARLLAPDHGNGFVSWLAGLTVTGRADLNLVFDTVGARRRHADQDSRQRDRAANKGIQADVHQKRSTPLKEAGPQPVPLPVFTIANQLSRA